MYRGSYAPRCFSLVQTFSKVENLHVVGWVTGSGREKYSFSYVFVEGKGGSATSHHPPPPPDPPPNAKELWEVLGRLLLRLYS